MAESEAPAVVDGGQKIDVLYWFRQNKTVVETMLGVKLKSMRLEFTERNTYVLAYTTVDGVESTTEI